MEITPSIPKLVKSAVPKASAATAVRVPWIVPPVPAVNAAVIVADDVNTLLLNASWVLKDG